ncbi:TlpA disulfide reductase family protein [Celeribacter indicus]|nr:TlpA disulfide reductase family protein [Celeribacter indicus]SDW42575.1 Thiol-disulfide isomerase or thioredoxin [Celeribacter indicus]
MLKKLIAATLYTALSLGAIPASGADLERAAALREDSLQKLSFHDTPKPVSDVVFTDPEGGEHRLSDHSGKLVLLNFWATWCAPCRKEMPELDALQTAYGAEGLEVLTVATGRNPLPAIRKFYDETDLTALPVLLDPQSALARDMAVLGLPVTVLIDPEGQEIARMTGDAEWFSSSAKALTEELLRQYGLASAP